ncbi:MAG: FAD-dependent oxidoreductase [Clostridia bacterium]|nr:FAD-dependent oxidoreductase [Clostridia bacterium]
MIYQKNLDFKYITDVFVAGGGAAGIAAAVAAARMGKQVFLAEASGCFGGLGTSGLVPAFAPFDDGVNILSNGIGYEIRQKLKNAVALRNWTTLDTEELKRAYDDIITEAGVKFSFFTTVYDVIVKDNAIEGVILGSKSGLFAVKAKIYIDCTGDGDLCAFGGGEYEKGDADGNVMPPTLCSIWSGIDKEECNEPWNKHVEQAYKDGVLSYEDRHIPGFFHGNDSISGGNIGHIFNIDPVDEAELTDGMLWGRKSMVEFENYFKRYFSGYKNLRLVSTAATLGVRESRRIKCDYTLNVDDFINRSVFEDEIGRYCYPVDIHVMSTAKKEYERFSKEYRSSLRYKSGESYGIPYRCLIPVSFKNALVAGRCIGTDRQMQASIRVMPGCFITGEAAGTAAALACEKEDVRSISIKELQQSLIKGGAYLPNFTK